MPDNTGYMIAAYVVTALVYLVYAGRLLTKGMNALRKGRD